MMVSGSEVRQVSGFLLGGFGRFRRAVFEAEAVVPGFENVAAVGKAVEQRRRHLGVTGHLWMPQRLTGESLRSGSLTRIIRCMAAAFRSATDALDEGRR